jgi:hypothetical protein
VVLDVNKDEMTIMGVKFENYLDFNAVWYAVSSNMIEGWRPKVIVIERMKERVIELRRTMTID